MRKSAPPVFLHHAGFYPGWRGKPAHMTPAETMLLYWYLETQPHKIEELWYDVAMDGIPGEAGTQLHTPFGTPGKFSRMWQRLTSKRADAIARIGNQYQILEMRANAKAQTLGELHQYQLLAQGEWPELTWLPILLITQSIDYATLSAIQSAGFTYSVAPDTLDLPRARGFKSLTARR
jgi:hypothetical protein